MARKQERRLDGITRLPKPDVRQVHPNPPPSIQVTVKLRISDRDYPTEIGDLEEMDIHLGSGTHGVVKKYQHRPSGTVMAVKKVTLYSPENIAALKGLQVEAPKMISSPHNVTQYGAFIHEDNLWMCMEFMDTSLHQFYRILRSKDQTIPEEYLSRITAAVIKGLKYLYDEMKVIHRDVKPSNILMDREGNVKVCEHIMSWFLVNSHAYTMHCGPATYLPPERLMRLNPERPFYDTRADVWSLGVSLIEVATGKHPYIPDGKGICDVDAILKIVNEEPARLPNESTFSCDFQQFVEVCCQKEMEDRPFYEQLLEHPFITKHKDGDAKMFANYVSDILDKHAAEFTKMANDQDHCSEDDIHSISP